MTVGCHQQAVVCDDSSVGEGQKIKITDKETDGHAVLFITVFPVCRHLILFVLHGVSQKAVGAASGRKPSFLCASGEMAAAFCAGYIFYGVDRCDRIGPTQCETKG